MCPVKNSAHFVERISYAPIHSNQMVSLDVLSQFTKVPTDETLAVVWDKLAVDPLLEELHLYPDRESNGNSDFLYGDNLLQDKVWYIPTRRRTGYRFAIVTSVG